MAYNTTSTYIHFVQFLIYEYDIRNHERNSFFSARTAHLSYYTLAIIDFNDDINPEKCGSDVKGVNSEHVLPIKLMSTCDDAVLRWIIQNIFDDKSTLVLAVFDFYVGPWARGRQLYCRACNFKNVLVLLAGNFYTCYIELNSLPLLMDTGTTWIYSKDIIHLITLARYVYPHNSRCQNCIS